MRRKCMERKKIVLSLIIVVGVVILFIGYMRFIRNPMQVTLRKVTLLQYEDIYGSLVIDSQLYEDSERFISSLPSANGLDYTQVHLEFEVENQSFFKTSSEYIYARDYDDTHIVQSNVGTPYEGDYGKHGMGTTAITMTIYFYTNGKTTEEVKEEIMKELQEISFQAKAEYDWIGIKDTTYQLEEKSDVIILLE